MESVKIKSSEVPKRREETENGECVAAQFEEIPMLLIIENSHWFRSTDE